jgi:hypothetical protein
VVEDVAGMSSSSSSSSSLTSSSSSSSSAVDSEVVVETQTPSKPARCPLIRTLLPNNS